MRVLDEETTIDDREHSGQSIDPDRRRAPIVE